MGIVIESESIGQQFGDWFDANIDSAAYQLKLDNGDLVWREIIGGKPRIFAKEPHTSWWTRAKIKMLGWLPVEGLM